MDDIANRFASLLADKGILLESGQLEQFEIYFRELIDWNKKVNLTGITEREQVYIKHFYDSVSLSFFLPVPTIENLIDIGSGAGFPGIPLKIAYPHLKVTIVDSLHKRIQFLQHIVSKLSLDQVNCIHIRAEDAARDAEFRDRFDMAAARAVARLNVLNELCLPFVRKGGIFAAMKGTDVQLEIKEAAYSLKELNAGLIGNFSFELPMEDAKRHVVAVRKEMATPAKYPRKAGIPSKFPLLI